jgi:hypothetical protein
MGLVSPYQFENSGSALRPLWMLINRFQVFWRPQPVGTAVTRDPNDV